MIRRLACLFALLSFSAAYLATVMMGLPPAVRLSRAIFALFLGGLVGSICAAVMQRLLLTGLAQGLDGPDAGGEQ